MFTIIGCGNLNRSDDGVGVVIAQQLAADLDPSLADKVRVYDAGTDGMGVMFKARGASALVIVDASRSGAAPGSVYEVPGEELERRPEPSLNLHDFRWDNALFVGRKLYGDSFPQDVTVYLIEAESLDLGLELTPVVRQAAETVTRKIQSRIDALPAISSREIRE